MRVSRVWIPRALVRMYRYPSDFHRLFPSSLPKRVLPWWPSAVFFCWGKRRGTALTGRLTRNCVLAFTLAASTLAPNSLQLPLDHLKYAWGFHTWGEECLKVTFAMCPRLARDLLCSSVRLQIHGVAQTILKLAILLPLLTSWQGDSLFPVPACTGLWSIHLKSLCLLALSWLFCLLQSAAIIRELPLQEPFMLHFVADAEGTCRLLVKKLCGTPGDCWQGSLSCNTYLGFCDEDNHNVPGFSLTYQIPCQSALFLSPGPI